MEDIIKSSAGVNLVCEWPIAHIHHAGNLHDPQRVLLRLLLLFFFFFPNRRNGGKTETKM